MPSESSARTWTMSVSRGGLGRDVTVVLLSDRASVGGAGRGRVFRNPAAKPKPPGPTAAAPAPGVIGPGTGARLFLGTAAALPSCPGDPRASPGGSPPP